jgi:tRNA dimethylallyltransferase
MLAQGWLEEVRNLLDRGVPENAKPFDFIGYRELHCVLKDEMKLEDAKAAIQQATRQYAKRQITWFRRETNVNWLLGFGDESKIQQEVLQTIRSAMQRPS